MWACRARHLSNMIASSVLNWLGTEIHFCYQHPWKVNSHFNSYENLEIHVSDRSDFSLIFDPFSNFLKSRSCIMYTSCLVDFRGTQCKQWLVDGYNFLDRTSLLKFMMMSLPFQCFFAVTLQCFGELKAFSWHIPSWLIHIRRNYW